MDDKYFIQKTKEQIFSEITILQNRSTVIPISKHNLNETPYADSQIVCRDNEIAELKSFIYGNPGDLRKQHSRCIFGYGGVGKTALVVETIKQILQDIIDNKTTNDYKPEYIFFFSAKKRKLQVSDATGRIIEKEIPSHFETADELIALIHEALSLETFKGYHDEGLIIVDNLEAVSIDDRRKIKHFIEAQTPPEMQFLLTSRNSEEYESNTRLCGFESEDGKTFVHSYIEENALDVRLEDSEINELLDIAKGNTLVLALSLRRISQKLIDMSGLRADFSCANVWKGIRKNMAVLPPNAYESISDFMFKDTFEQIESVFDNPELFYEILRVFAVIPNKGIDLSTVCLLTNISYPDVEAVAETLCNYLIVERNGNTFRFCLHTFPIVHRPAADRSQNLLMYIGQNELQPQVVISVVGHGQKPVILALKVRRAFIRVRNLLHIVPDPLTSNAIHISEVFVQNAFTDQCVQTVTVQPIQVLVVLNAKCADAIKSTIRDQDVQFIILLQNASTRKPLPKKRLGDKVGDKTG